MTTVILVNGWGYDASIWDAVRSRLTPALRVETLDLGFFSAADAAPPAPTFAEPVIAVGHSLGALWWLAKAEIPWRRLLCINGFPRFTETPGYAPAIAPRVLARMQTQFAREPAMVLAEFHVRCGAAGPTVTSDTPRLAAGLNWLSEWDGRARLAARSASVFALAAANDPIVPRAMSEMAFAALPAGHLEYLDDAGHVLPQAAPDHCARLIERLAQ
jgi:pimeloyl-ACP methyl ester carboxylesterase